MLRRWLRNWLGIERIDKWIFIHAPLLPSVNPSPGIIAQFNPDAKELPR